MTIQPIAKSIRQLKRQIADAEWNNQPTASLKARLASLELMQRYGEEWDVPF